MAEHDYLNQLEGDWRGPSNLWMNPAEPPIPSEWTASVARVACGQFLAISYAWEFNGDRKEGVLTFGLNGDSEKAGASWLDSWHMANQIMVCDRKMREDGSVAMLGNYAAPPGPDWGWRIEIHPGGDADSFVLKMFNITPDGEEAPAVQTDFVRRK